MTNNSTRFGQSLPQNDDSSIIQPCPRHPQARTALRCQRCNRPMCTDCARQAAVGMQCVDCVLAHQQQNQNTRAGWGTKRRSAYYRGASGNWLVRTWNTAPATMVFAIICIVAFIGQVAYLPLTEMGDFAVGLAIIEPYRFITSGFLHVGIWHLAMNMFALLIVGPPVEQALGTWRYVVFYLLSTVGGSVGLVVYTYFNDEGFTISEVGASGAGFALFAAVYILQKRAQADLRPITVLLVVNLAFSFAVPGVAWQGHLGGLLTGAIVTAGFYAVTEAAVKARTTSFAKLGSQGANRQMRKVMIWGNTGVILGTILLLVLACVPTYAHYWPLLQLWGLA